MEVGKAGRERDGDEENFGKEKGGDMRECGEEREGGG
jgi:hypothetical protein